MAVQITIDDQTYTLRDDVDPEELRRRVAQAVFRCEVEQLHLADGRRVLVNWRSVRLVHVDVAPPGSALPGSALPGDTSAVTGAADTGAAASTGGTGGGVTHPVMAAAPSHHHPAYEE
ncbi:hypothetical protein UG55_101632 [Frankia sp. EI5c]|uniref:hypothetical protein n=1 Tax=Frankia sp. EI5c TaxID=683316 RepID=UPI0007C2CDFD|nr:hypothetical protein [Frankia sp. EI5c]OAA26368.1 hypothetical protein UG55_101632 [Frankia sp. EI5c]